MAAATPNMSPAPATKHRACTPRVCQGKTCGPVLRSRLISRWEVTADPYRQVFRLQLFDQPEQYLLNVGSRIAPHELEYIHSVPVKKISGRHDLRFILCAREPRPRLLQRGYPAFPAAVCRDIGGDAIVEVRNDVD